MFYIAFTNQSFPRHDAADYLSVSDKILIETRQMGWSTFPENLYHIRNWKPIILPSITAVFSVLTGGELLVGAKIQNLFFLALSLLYFFRLSRLLTGNTQKSLLVASTVIMFSGALDLLCVYTAEIVQLTCSAGFMAHYFSKEKSTADYWLAIFWVCLGLMARPAEILMFIFVIVVFEMCKSFKESPLQTLWATFSFLIFAAGLHRAAAENLANSSLMLGSCVAALVLLCFKKRMNFFLHLYVTAQITASLWYWSYFNQVYGWVWTSSIGVAAKLTGQRGDMSAISFVLRIFRIIGSAEFSVLIFTCILLFCTALGRTIFVKKNKLDISLSSQDFLIFFSLCTPILIGTFGANADLRYYITIVLLFTVFIYSKLIKNLESSASVQKFILIGSFTGLFAWQLFHFYRFDQTKSTAYIYGPYYKFSRYSTSPDPIRQFADQLSENKELKEFIRPRINTVNWNCGSDISQTTDTWPLRILLHEKGLDWSVDRVLIFNFKTREERLNVLKHDADFVVAGPIDNCRATYDNSNPVSELTEYLVTAFKNNTIQQTGFEFLGLIPGSGRDGSTGQFLLLKTLR